MQAPLIFVMSTLITAIGMSRSFFCIGSFQADWMVRLRFIVRGVVHVATATPGNNENRPWVRIASSVLSARGLLRGNKLLAESTLEAMRTQGFRRRCHALVDNHASGKSFPPRAPRCAALPDSISSDDLHTT